MTTNGVKNWQVGQVFISTKFDDEAFVVSSISPIGEQKYDAKGKAKPMTYGYSLEYIPETVNRILPSGSNWEHKRKPFISNDDLIKREIDLGNWIAGE